MDECNLNWYTHPIDTNFQCFQIQSERMSITNKCFNILNTKQRPGFISLGQEDSLEKGMATYSSNLAWEIPWTKEHGGLQSMRSQRVRHDWATNTSSINYMQVREEPKQANLAVQKFHLQLKRSESEWLANLVDTLHPNESFFLWFFSAYMYVD